MCGMFNSFDTEGRRCAVPEEGKQIRDTLMAGVTKRPFLNTGSVLFFLLMCDEKEVMKAAYQIQLLIVFTLVFG